MKKSEALHILGLADGASDDDIKKAHRRLIIENHPDKFGQDATKRAAAEEKTKRINEARDVLLSRKWDPEYKTTGTPYGAPYSYDPFSQTRPRSSAGQGTSQDPFNGQNPFAGFPFETFVWTSWDNIGTNPGNPGNRSQNAQHHNPYTTQNPFAGHPFESFFTVRQQTPEEQLEETKGALKLDFGMLVFKAVLFATAAFMGNLAMGVFLYVVLSIGQGIYKRLRFLSGFIILPFLICVMIFTPRANAAVSTFAFVCLLFALWFDVSNITGHIRSYRELKKQIKNHAD